jgi:hypothetical protein
VLDEGNIVVSQEVDAEPKLVRVLKQGNLIGEMSFLRGDVIAQFVCEYVVY